MSWRRHFGKIAALLRRKKPADDLTEEIRAHLEMEEQENREAGMPPEEAHYAALRRFGNVTQVQERSREAWGWRWLETLLQDVRYGLRQLRRNPGFTAVAVLTLALGIGANTAIFSVVNGVLLKPLPYLQPGRLVALGLASPGIKPSTMHISPAFYFVFRRQSRTFRDVGIYGLGRNGRGGSENVTGSGLPGHVWALRVTDGVLPTLGVTPLFGRSFTRADDEPGSPDTVMLSYGFWRGKFGGSRSVIGKALDVNCKPRTIIGVLPERFRFLDKTNLDILLPIKLRSVDNPTSWFGFYGAIARLKPGVTLAEAKADVTRMIPITLRSHPVPPGISREQFENVIKKSRLGARVRQLKQEVVGGTGKILWVLMGGISLVLLIACANVGNLLLVRNEGRRQELAIRTALGASRCRIAASFFSESLILAVLGGLLGLGLAYGALWLLVAVAPPALPRLNEISIDGRVVLFALAVSAAASLVFGLVPVFKYPVAMLGSRLRAGGRSMSESRERHRSRSMLVIVQVALALILLVSSGLMIRTFRALTGVNPGFVEPSDVLTFRVSIPDAQVKDSVRVVRVEEEISQEIEALPGVSSVGISRNLPMDGSGWMGVAFVKDRTYAPGESPPLCRWGFFGPGFLKTLGTPLIAGRDFTWSDIYNKLPVAMISENLARVYWNDPANALGRHISVESPKAEWREVVGVVGDVHQDGVDKDAPITVYFPILMDQFRGNRSLGIRRNVAFAIRSLHAGSESFINEVRRAVWSVDPNLPLFEVRTLAYYYNESMARTSFTLVMLALAGGMALLLGIVGLYGAIAHSVSQRTHEIGIRMALGAERRDVLKMVVGQGLKLALTGMAIGIAGALALTRFLSSLLYGVKPTDPLTFTAVSLILIAVALLACYIPARRAAKVDPMVALRYE